MREVIFFDVDNTLVDSNTHKIPESTVYALSELGKKYDLGIATGRSLHTLIDNGVIDAYPWSLYVCNNGQLVYDSQKAVIYAKPIPPHAVKTVMKVAREHHFALLLGTPLWYQYGEVTEYERIAHDFFQIPIPESLPVPFEENVYMMVTYGPMYDKYDEFRQIEGIQIIPGQSTYCDILDRDSGKEKGILAAQKLLHFPSYIAFGDSDNDLGMFAHARYSIVMGQGSEAAKKAADYITKAVDDDGIADVLIHCDLLKQ